MTLYEMLDAYRRGERGLPTYLELIAVDDAIARKDARIAALVQTVHAMAQEKTTIQQHDPYFLSRPHAN